MAFAGVHPEDEGVLLLHQRPAVAKFAQLFGADGGVVSRVENEDNVTSFEPSERDDFAVLIGEREIGVPTARGCEKRSIMFPLQS
jgi:hypothetical protein